MIKFYDLSDIEVIEMLLSEYASLTVDAVINYGVKLYFDLAMYLVIYEKKLREIEADGLKVNFIDMSADELSCVINSELEAISKVKGKRFR